MGDTFIILLIAVGDSRCEVYKQTIYVNSIICFANSLSHQLTLAPQVFLNALLQLT